MPRNPCESCFRREARGHYCIDSNADYVPLCHPCVAELRKIGETVERCED